MKPILNDFKFLQDIHDADMKLVSFITEGFVFQEQQTKDLLRYQNKSSWKSKRC